ncbi:MAG: citrate lyase holo-[acyl-carrier protein] synthase [Clostridiales bacterium]|nr:citrate lyase holo-[acyl-carrier protein] synthase [Clostridiales bacterium]
MEIDKIFTGVPVTVDALLRSRDERVQRQRALFDTGAPCVISFTLNIPGEIKMFPLAQDAFRAGLAALYRSFSEQIAEVSVHELPTGCEAQLAVNAFPTNAKLIAIGIELSHPFGRLYDIDVLTPEGKSIHREELGFPSRQCLLCGKDAKHCGRSHAHSIQELRYKVASILKDRL